MLKVSPALRLAIVVLLLLAAITCLVLFIPAIQAQMQYNRDSQEFERHGDR